MGFETGDDLLDRRAINREDPSLVDDPLDLCHTPGSPSGIESAESSLGHGLRGYR